MRASHRWILALAAGIVVAGVVGVAVHHAPAAGSPGRASPAPTTKAATATSRPATSHPSTTTPAPPPTVVAAPPATSAALAANVLIPTDLGGFYSVSVAAANALLDSAPCLAGLAPSAAQTGRAVTGLLGPDAGSAPDITEVVISYPGATAAAVYRSLTAAIQACPNFGLSIGGTPVDVPMAAGNMPTAGDASSVYQGQFLLRGRRQQLGIAFVLAGRIVLTIVYIDTVPPSNTLFGDLPSTVSAALRKEA
ncbi:MAG TPA: hypothetical protein VGL49_03200 [Acidimicrobiales bacterium]